MANMFSNFQLRIDLWCVFTLLTMTIVKVLFPEAFNPKLQQNDSWDKENDTLTQTYGYIDIFNHRKWQVNLFGFHTIVTPGDFGGISWMED